MTYYIFTWYFKAIFQNSKEGFKEYHMTVMFIKKIKTVDIHIK